MLEQRDIDGVAHYAEAAIKLRLSPFVHEDTRQMTLHQQGGAISASLADEQVLTGFLFPFRQIWLKDEPANFTKVRNILWQCSAEGPTRALLAHLYSDYRKACLEWFPQPEPSYGITPEDVVDLMLNTRYAHAGCVGTKGKFSRHDLEHFEKSLGVPKLEWLFHSKLHELSLVFMMLGDFAMSALDHWARSDNLRPTFRLSSPAPLGDLAIELKPLPRVKRSTPGWTPQGETELDQLKRLLRRDGFRNLAQLLECLSLSEADLVGTIRTVSGVHDLIGRSGFKWEQHTDIEESTNVDYMAEKVSWCYSRKTWQKGVLALRSDGTLRTFGDALPIIQDELLALQKLLAEGESCRLWTNHPRRFQWA